MSIRIATIEDLDLVVEMGLKFISSTNYKDYADEATIRNLAEGILNSPKEERIILLHENKGMLVGALAPFIFGTIKVATEVAWWIEPEHRGSKAGSELLEAFEYWANKVGCNLIIMISLDDKIGKFYEKKGYVLQERTYTKEL